MTSKLPRLRFYLDENFPVPAGKFLCSMCQNVKHVINTRSARERSDEWQLKYAAKNKRIFIALDRDFKHRKSLQELIIKSPGLILIKSSNPQTDKIIQILKKVQREITKNKIKGKICLASMDKLKFDKP